MKQLLLILVSIALAVPSCKPKQSIKEKQSEIKTGSLSDENIYTATEVGWKTKIPAGWDVLTKNENEQLTDKGRKEVEKANDVQIDASSLTQLVNLKKDPFNSFLSTMEPFDKNLSYEETNKKVMELLKTTYSSKDIYGEYSEGTEKVDGLDFYTFSAKLYAKDKSKVILNQKMFSRLINNYDFSMTITYNNEDDKKTLTDMMMGSTFSIRN